MGASLICPLLCCPAAFCSGDSPNTKAQFLRQCKGQGQEGADWKIAATLVEMPSACVWGSLNIVPQGGISKGTSKCIGMIIIQMFFVSYKKIVIYIYIVPFLK